MAALNKAGGEKNKIGEKASDMLQSPQPPPSETIWTSLINEFALFHHKYILILDDYHLIDAQTVHDSLRFLLDHQPPNLHLVIVTREDPPLNLSKLRVRSQLTELRAADLRFTFSESVEFLNQVIGLNLSSEDISALETRTEGWIAGLQLAAISLQGHTDTTRLIQSFTGSNRFVLDYLVEEVLNQQPESIQTFLLYTSILDRLCGSLCDSILPAHSVSGQEMLKYLEQANLLLVPLDNRRHWYRYHHLFADVLQAHLKEQFPDQVNTLHMRASEWYAQKDLPFFAIRHAIEAQDFERAASQAELAWPAMSGSFQSIEWLGWLKALPDELVRDRPVLSVGIAWALLNSGKLEDAEAKLMNAERWMQTNADMDERLDISVTGMVVDDQQFESLPISLAAARAYHAQAIGDLSGTVKYARRVLDALPEENSEWRGDANALLGLAYWAQGDLEAAHQTFIDGLAGMAPLDVIIGTFVLSDIKMVLGQFHTAISRYEQSLRLAIEHGEPFPLGTEDLYIGISLLHREQGDLETAENDLLTAKKLGEQIELPDWQYRWCIAQARLMEAQGKFGAALELFQEAERLYVRTPLPDVRPIPAMKVRVCIKQGKLDEASDWVRQRALTVQDDLPSVTIIVRQLQPII
ncbi:MAG: hypothetical protein JEZ06_19290 [Anaerolineaceae bacterium]|nr:hypothetical protein [Anaerolineaceae bacterium]